MRVLDEVADAVRRVCGRGVAPFVHSSVLLEDIFGGQISSRRQAVMEKHLGCRLPPLEFDQGHWFRTDPFETIWDLVVYVARQRPDWEPPTEMTVAAWQNAQIFVGVRDVLVDVGNLDPKDVVREARLLRDLRLE